MTYEQETCWLAGLLEGEGCFTTRRQNHEIRIQLAMSDEDTVRRAAEIMGCTSSIRSRKREANYAVMWECYIMGDRGAAVARRILPYMSKRRTERINFLLERLSLRFSRRESGLLGAHRRWGTPHPRQVA